MMMMQDAAAILRQVVKNLKAQGQEGQSKAASDLSTPTGNELYSVDVSCFLSVSKSKKRKQKLPHINGFSSN